MDSNCCAKDGSGPRIFRFVRPIAAADLRTDSESAAVRSRSSHDSDALDISPTDSRPDHDFLERITLDNTLHDCVDRMLCDARTRCTDQSIAIPVLPNTASHRTVASITPGNTRSKIGHQSGWLHRRSA